jgi:hypothetical protein
MTYVNSLMSNHTKKCIQIHIYGLVCSNSYRKKQHTNLYIQIRIELTKGQPQKKFEQQPKMIDEWVLSQR